MIRGFQIGDHVSWNSEAGRVSGTITKVHRRDFDYKGYTHHASARDPQYEIHSDRTDHVAVHKGGALRKLRQLGGAPSASGRTLPGIEARTPSDQRERPEQKVASHLRSPAGALGRPGAKLKRRLRKT